MKKVTLNLGSGGREMHSFIKEQIASKLGNEILIRFDDSAIMENKKDARMAMTTDSFVVNPIFFPGGDIGRLCIAGTVNDLSTSGATPYALSLAFILEEGTLFSEIEKVIDSIAIAAKEANVKIVTGDTKVVEKGKGDKIYINTCGIGYIPNHLEISSYNAKTGDIIMVTGPLGNHEVAMMKARGMIDFDIKIISDVAPLNIKLAPALSKNIHAVKDPTRGGLAGALNEIAEHSNVEIKIYEDRLPIDKEVKAICNLVGFDPLYLANEGKFVIVCDKKAEVSVKNVFKDACIIGEVLSNQKASLVLETLSGGLRKVGVLETTQLPRIC